MQNFITMFSPSKSFPFLNEQLCWEQRSPHRHDCHGPPHASRVGLHDDRSPPRRLAAVARSDPWKTPPAQVGFRGDATRRRRLGWAASSRRRLVKAGVHADLHVGEGRRHSCLADMATPQAKEACEPSRSALTLLGRLRLFRCHLIADRFHAFASFCGAGPTIGCRVNQLFEVDRELGCVGTADFT
jgi:hypothetical protein